MNPLLEKWTTPLETPPFDIIKTEHFIPAIREAIKIATEEINSITDNSSSPDFENTIATLDRSGETLGRIASVLFNLNSAETNKELQDATQEVSALLTRFSNDITLNEKLFEKINACLQKKRNLRSHQGTAAAY